MEKWLSANAIASLLKKDKRVINRRAKNENWAYRSYAVRGGKQKRFHLAGLPEDIQRTYAASVNMDVTALKGELKPVSKPEAKAGIDGYACRSAGGKTYKSPDDCTEAEREVALNRQKVIAAYEKAKLEGMNAKQFVAFYNEGNVLPEVKARLGRWGELTDYRRFYDTWLKPYALAGLAPQYKKRGGHGGGLSQEVKDLLEYLYLDTNRPSVADVVRHLHSVYGHEEVNQTIAYRYLTGIPQAFRDYHRRGAAYFERHQPYISRDYTALKPMEVIVGDYMTQDFMLRLGEKVFRAKVAAFMDMRTRAILGWSLQTTANSTGVAMALQKCFDRFGLPETIYFDNGREFKNRFLCGGGWKTRASKIDADDVARNIGVVVEAGVNIIFATPYNGKAKPIDRFWRTLHEGFDKWMPTYVGSNTADSPDDSKVYKRRVGKTRREDFEAIPEFAAVEALLGHFFEWYNHTHKHTGQGMDGKTPMGVWNEYNFLRRDVPAALKPYLFTHRYTKTVQNKGIRHDGLWYYAPEVIRYAGEKAQVRVPPEMNDTIHVFDLAGKKLFDAAYLEEGDTVAEKIETVKRLKQENAALAKKYNKNKKELDRQGFKTAAEAWAEENPEALPDSERRVVGGEPLPAAQSARPKSKLIKLFK